MTNQSHQGETADDLDDFFNEVSQVEAEVGDVPEKSQNDDNDNPQPPPAKKPKLLRPPGAVMVAAASSATTLSSATTAATIAPGTRNHAQHLQSESQPSNVTSRSTSYPPPPPPPTRGSVPPPPPPPPPLPPPYPSGYATQQQSTPAPPPFSAIPVGPYPTVAAVPLNSKNNSNNIDDWPAGGFRLFVGNLGNEITDHDLFQHFSVKYPSLERARVISSAATYNASGGGGGPKPKKKAQSSYGFVCFGNALECARAKREMDQTWLGSRPIRIKKYLGDTGAQAAVSNNNGKKSSTRRGQR